MKIILGVTLLFFLFSACNNDQKIADQVWVVKGETMGTYYNIRYVSPVSMITKENLDSVLIALNNEVSTYIKSSRISRINSKPTEELMISEADSPHFLENYRIAKELYAISGGYFDPTLNPLVSFWGFGYNKKAYAQKDTTKIPELLKLVSFDLWLDDWSGDSILYIQKPKKASLDFSAIAKGYGVDLVGDYIASKGIDAYFVDIGGEVTSKGYKPGNTPWIIGINRPVEDATATDADLFLNISNLSIATSGNYRNFYEENGQKYSHTINPFTGLSERSNLLSSSIVHQRCAQADAMATACMSMGLDKSKILIDSLTDYEGLFIYNDVDGKLKIWKSSGFDFIIENDMKK